MQARFRWETKDERSGQHGLSFPFLPDRKACSPGKFGLVALEKPALSGAPYQKRGSQKKS
jgi:hypothetical protein